MHWSVEDGGGGGSNGDDVETFLPRILFYMLRLFDSRQMNKGIPLVGPLCNYTILCNVYLYCNLWANLLESLFYFFIVFNSVRLFLHCYSFSYFHWNVSPLAFHHYTSALAPQPLWSTFVALQMSFTTHTQTRWLFFSLARSVSVTLFLSLCIFLCLFALLRAEMD